MARSVEMLPVRMLHATGISPAIVIKRTLEAAPDWRTGACLFGNHTSLGDDILCVGIIVASELRGKRSTALRDVIAAGQLMEQVVEDLMALPPNAHERVVAEPFLRWLRNALGKQRIRSPEDPIIIAMHELSEDARTRGLVEGHAAGHAEGRAEARGEGFAEGYANAVLTVLGARGIAVPAAARKRILAENDPDRLERWLEKASVVASVAEVIDGEPAERTSRTARPAARKGRIGRRRRK